MCIVGSSRCWYLDVNVLGSSRSPECVMVCILPASVPSHDVTFHIQQTLVEAFCVEHAIPILKVTAITFLGRKIFMTYNHDNCNNSHPCVICIDFCYTHKRNRKIWLSPSRCACNVWRENVSLWRGESQLVQPKRSSHRNQGGRFLYCVKLWINALQPSMERSIS